MGTFKRAFNLGQKNEALCSNDVCFNTFCTHFENSSKVNCPFPLGVKKCISNVLVLPGKVS